MNLTLLIIILVVSAFFYSFYSSVIRNRNAVLEALSGIDVQLKKRYDLIPNVLTIARKFMEHENELFENIVKLRTQSATTQIGTKEKFEIENALSFQLRTLIFNAENYPALKSNETMVQAMRTYNETEENISAARRFYNSALTQLKNSVQIFPGSLFASFASDVINFSYFETDSASKVPIDPSKYL